MSVLSVAKKDFTGATRSRSLWAAAVLLGVVATLMGYVGQRSTDTATENVLRTFNTLTMILAVLLPIVALTAAYMAVAGEREGGGIKFLLSLPNTRRDVFLGKLVSRLVVVAAGVVFAVVAVTSMSVAKHGAFPARAVVGILLVTVVYGSVFVAVAVAVSAASASRSRAIGSALASYLVLVILYVFPVVQVKTLVEGVHATLLGLERNPDLYNAVQYTSPYLAYRKAINLVVPDQFEQGLFLDSARNVPDGVDVRTLDPGEYDLPLYLSDEFSLAIMAFWIVVPLLLGYWAFERADLE